MVQDTGGASFEFTYRREDGKHFCIHCEPEREFAQLKSLVRHLRGEHPGEIRERGVSAATDQLALLERIGCSLDPVYPLVVCDHETCKCAVDPAALIVHLGTHSIRLDPTELTSLTRGRKLLNRRGFYEAYPGIIPPVGTVPVNPEGYLCGVPGCEVARGSEVTMKRHCKDDHPGEGAFKLYQKGPIQSVFGPSSRNTRVAPASADSESRDRSMAFMRSVPEAAKQDISKVHSAGLSRFLRAVRWAEFFEQIGKGERAISTSKLFELAHVDRSTASDGERWLRAIVRDYTETLTPLVRSCEHLSLRLINTKQGETSHSAWDVPQERATREKYSDRLFDLVMFVLKTLPEKQTFASSLTEVQTHLARRLEALVSRRDDGESAKEVLHELAWSLVAAEYSIDCSNQFKDPTIQFLIGSSLHKDGSLLACRDITSVVASLQSTFRLVVFKQSYDDGKSRGKPILDFVKVHRVHILEGERSSTFDSLQQIMHIGSSLANSDNGLPKIIWLSPGRFMLDGDLIEMQKVRDMLAKELDRCERLLRDRVTRGVPIDDLVPDLQVISDELRSNRSGYSFLTDTRNPFHRSPHAFSLRLFTDPIWGPIFGKVQGDDGIEWNREAVAEWMADLNDFKETLFLLVHLTSGLPARGTESSETLISNTDTAQRNFYCFGNRMCLVGTYNKTSRITGNRNKLLPRGLEERTGSFMLKYLALLRPLERVLARQTVDERHWHLYDTHLWTGGSGKWDTRRFSRILDEAFKHHLKVPMSMASWRHACTAVMRRHLTKQLDLQPEIQQDLFEAMADEQSGHTHAVSLLNYGVEVTGFDLLPERKFRLFLLVSDLYQSCLHLKELKKESLQELLGTDESDPVPKLPTAFTIERPADVHQLLAAEGRIAEVVATKVLTSLRKTLAEEVMPALSESLADRLGSKLKWRTASAHDRPRQVDPAVPPHPQGNSDSSSKDTSHRPVRTGVEVDPTLLEHLCKILKDQNATWTSKEQADSVQNIAHNRGHNTITVLRTGSGKTIAYVLPALFVADHGSYVVAVPNRALLEDLKRRVRSFGLECKEWKAGKDFGSRAPAVIFVSADVMCSEGFLAVLKALKASGVLKGIVLDEVHKWVQEGHYRYRLQDVNALASLRVPLHCFTATLKPDQTHKVAGKFGLRTEDFKIVRGSTDRPNLEYRVVRVASSPGYRVQKVVEAVVAEIKDRTRSMKRGELGLVISRSVDTAKAIAEELGCGRFHAKRDEWDEDPQVDYGAWQAERELEVPTSAHSRWLSATPLVDTGNDTKGVVVTLFCEPPFDMISLLQGAGRTAREGQRGAVTVYFDEYRVGAVDPHADGEFADVEGVRRYVENADTCRRFLITSSWDETAVSCSGIPDGVQCDICQQKRKGVRPYIPRAVAGDLRTAEEAFKSFDERLAASKEDSDLLLVIYKHLVTLGACPFHFASSGEVAIHPAKSCELKKSFGGVEFSEFERRLKWQPGYVCFHCFFPHGAKDGRFHEGGDWSVCKSRPLDIPGDPSKGTFARQSKSFLSGVMWSIFSSEESRAVADKEFGTGRVPGDLKDYCKTVTEQTKSSLPTGLVLVARCLRGHLAKFERAYNLRPTA